MSISVQTTPPAFAASHQFVWLGSGRTFLDQGLRAIREARQTIELETYIFTHSPIGRAFRDALAEAAQRGVKVRLLVDGFGSGRLPSNFFAPVLATGGVQKWFNRPRLGTWALRDHRKVLLVDRVCAYVGGCNIAEEYHGDGITQGWRDGGISVEGPVVAALAREFDHQWERADQRQWRRINDDHAEAAATADVQALFVKPGIGANPLRTWLREDLQRAHNVSITSSYFLPTRRLRQEILQAGKRGARVRLLLPGKSDIPLMALATRSLYRQLLRGGVAVYEYQPQILHAKTMVLDDIVYIGSSNLDPRSMRINFEIMLRIKDSALAEAAHAQFARDLEVSRKVTVEEANSVRSWWMRIKQGLAYFLLARLDPWIARGHLRRMNG